MIVDTTVTIIDAIVVSFVSLVALTSLQTWYMFNGTIIADRSNNGTILTFELLNRNAFDPAVIRNADETISNAQLITLFRLTTSSFGAGFTTAINSLAAFAALVVFILVF
jgi:hypothetical protein